MLAMMRIIGLILTFSTWSKGQTIQMAPLTPTDMTHEVYMDQVGNYLMRWTPRDQDIIFEVQVATTGYVGFGFSTNGGMRGADIIIGGVDDATNEIYLTDRFASGNMVPEVDTIQDVQLLGGYQNETHTSLRFSRPWHTCDDDHDIVISKKDTVRLIWSYGTSDPEDGNPMAIKYHSQRGSKSMYLNEPLLQMPEMGDDVKSWEIRSPNVRLPDDLTTLYWCKLFKIPPHPTKTHVIRYEPVISEDNIQHVHHILLYECHLPETEKYLEKWVDVDGAQCYGPNMPISWMYCASPLVAWGVGGGGSFAPENAGFPLGDEHGGATYFMMEMHYDNPNLRQGIVDNSGLRIYYTENLRPNDAGILMLGNEVTPLQIIPPGQHWLSIGHCSSDCTNKHLPESGINVFAGILHSHLLGRNMSLRHIRDKKEMPIVIRDLNYDFNFQETRNFAEELTIMPNDFLITECGLDSTGRDGPSFGGFGTEEEMCLAFLYYYPRVELASCTSSPSPKSLFYTLGIRDVQMMQRQKQGTINEYGFDEEAETMLAEELRTGRTDPKLDKVQLNMLLRGIIAKAPARYENQTIYDIVTSRDTWTDESLVQRLQDVVISGEHTQKCNLKKFSRGEKIRDDVTISYPEFTPLSPPESENCVGAKEQGPDNRKQFKCPPQLPNCNPGGSNSILGNRPTFF